MNVWGVTFGGYLAKILSFKSGNLLYKSNFYLLSEGTVSWLSSIVGWLKLDKCHLAQSMGSSSHACAYVGYSLIHVPILLWCGRRKEADGLF